MFGGRCQHRRTVPLCSLQLLRGRTSFIVAHRLSTIKNCTRIFYIENGRIAESGSHDELIKKQGLYYKLYMSQMM